MSMFPTAMQIRRYQRIPAPGAFGVRARCPSGLNSLFAYRVIRYKVLRENVGFPQYRTATHSNRLPNLLRSSVPSRVDVQALLRCLPGCSSSEDTYGMTVESVMRWVSGAVRLLVVVPFAFLADAAFSHHSVFTNFDTSASVEITGTVTSVSIRNPHSQYVLDVAVEDDATEEWLIEWSDRNALIRRQVALDRIKVGDEITVTAWPSRRLERIGYFIQAVLPDGSTFRDCGFREFREAVVNSAEFRCPESGAGE